jgi:hypothetical protein
MQPVADETMIHGGEISNDKSQITSKHQCIKSAQARGLACGLGASRFGKKFLLFCHRAGGGGDHCAKTHKSGAAAGNRIASHVAYVVYGG